MSTQIMLLYISCSPLTRCTDTSFCFQSLFSRVRSRSLPRAASDAATHPPPSHSEVHSESSLQLLEKSWTEKQTNASITDQKEIVVSDTWPDLRWTTARPVLGNNLGSSWRQYFFKFLSRSSLQTSIPSLQRRTPEEQGQPGARLTEPREAPEGSREATGSPTGASEDPTVPNLSNQLRGASTQQTKQLANSLPLCLKPIFA